MLRVCLAGGRLFYKDCIIYTLNSINVLRVCLAGWFAWSGGWRAPPSSWSSSSPPPGASPPPSITSSRNTILWQTTQTKQILRETKYWWVLEYRRSSEVCLRPILKNLELNKIEIYVFKTLTGFHLYFLTKNSTIKVWKRKRYKCKF